MGIDGISLAMIALTAFLMPLAIRASWHQSNGFIVTLLFLETGMMGAFCAIDLFLFYVFWEAMLIPMYLLIGIWGGPRRIYASVKFILYTIVGSVLMLAAILYVALQAGTFDVLALQEKLPGLIDPDVQPWLFLAFAVSFAIKVPLFPFHTWLPDAHVEAPTAGSVILAGVLLKMGTYGFLRFAIPFFPEAAATSPACSSGSRRSASSTARSWRWPRATSRSWSPTRASPTWASACWASSPARRRGPRARCSRWSTTASRPARCSSWSA
jgi:NADH-quinone oxidoreductase subunit M